MPTRLIDVPLYYVALSHCWGDAAVDGTFRTTHAIIGKLKQGFDLDKLPEAFQDAVKVTRGVNIQVLWIDSICVTQDDSADWEVEPRCMERIFSSAYCVLAAGSSRGTSGDFFHAHSSRNSVTFETRDGGQFYVCESIDDFHKDTSNQTYWECGEGIRCETLTKMTNSKSSILGDSHFPQNAMRLESKSTIHVYQSLYEKYSRLAFTEIQDRPIAILGLENRLVQTFNPRGKYGILECFLHRSLLWQRGDDEMAMRQINFPQGRTIPAYVELSEAFRYSAGYSSYTGDAEALGKLDVVVHDYDASRISPYDAKFKVVFDEPKRREHFKGQCVVLGQEKMETSGEKQRHYVLFVTQKFLAAYERVGVGILPRECIDWAGIVAQ
ncbi:heterokaryon incompatibility protein-domain-containing protein [Xylaria acuta]|nr:heterokaryon incompatibility protein-domain-containing protein [Xylaria acuta]